MLLGGPRGTSGRRKMEGRYREIYLSNGPEEAGVDRDQGTHATQVYPLCGKVIPRGHWKGPPGPGPVYWMDRLGWVLPLEGSPTGPGPPRPLPPG